MTSINETQGDDLGKLCKNYQVMSPHIQSAFFKIAELSARASKQERENKINDGSIPVLDEDVQKLNATVVLLVGGDIEEDLCSIMTEDIRASTKYVHFLRGIQLEVLIGQYDDGDNSALLRIVNHCIKFNIEVPPKFKATFDGAVSSWTDAEVDTLDQAFNVERPKNWRKKAENRKIHLMAEVYDAVMKLKRERWKVGRRLFEEVAPHYRISGALAREYFYLYRSILLAKDKRKEEILKERFLKLKNNPEYSDFVRGISKIP